MTDQIIKIKPKIEDVISDHLDSDMKQATLDFVEYMRENKMPLKLYTTSTRRWRATYKGKTVCSIVIDKNSWLIGHADWPLTKCDYSSGYESIMASTRAVNLARSKPIT